MLGVYSSAIAQTNSQIKKNIDLLLIAEQQQEAITFLYQIIQQNPKALVSYSKELSNNLNQALQTGEFNYALANLALETSASSTFQLSPASEKVLSKQNESIRQKLKQTDSYHNWIWEDEAYMMGRAESGLILDLLGYGTSQTSLEELKASLDYFTDNRPKYFAVAALLRRSGQVNTKHYQSLAKDDETRGLLYMQLKNLNKLSLFPEAYHTQIQLSKADMVNWLIYPTELNTFPTEIELVKMFTIEYSDVGPADFYLWKFRADNENWKNDGWMAGLSGPFVRANGPSMDAYGYTFSAFTAFDKKSPEEHFDEIVNIIEEWNAKNKK
ncbi:hypothetical protein EV197_2152 [Aquimarina brevivitae]|uniref:Uncharacterized protein n=1 Tax=Aquimarina brevivitae TaxID=323412 RepID=A0A4Q7P4F8_9FLAO|nr:hypothetical protein EV197_2152 [Aquimarina brevivitae]